MHSLFVMSGRMERILILTSKEPNSTTGLPFSRCCLRQSSSFSTLLSLPIKHQSPSSQRFSGCGTHTNIISITWEHVGSWNSWSQSSSVLSSGVGPRPTELLFWKQGSRFWQASPLVKMSAHVQVGKSLVKSYHWINFWFSHSEGLSMSVWFHISEFHTDVFLYV